MKYSPFQAFLFWIFLISTLQAQVVENQDPDRASQPMDWATELITPYFADFPEKTRLAIAFVDGSQVSYLGLEKRPSGLVPIENQDSVFEIGSITKVFTGILLAEAVKTGKVNLDEPIDPYLSFPLKDSAQITFRQLANHSSGLPRIPFDLAMEIGLNPSNPFQSYDKARLENYLKEGLYIQTEPGTAYQYSNLGMGILGYMLAEIYEEPYEELLDKRIFKPYSLHQTTANREKVSSKLVKGQDPAGKLTPNWDLASMAGAGAVLSSAQDLARFIQLQFDSSNQVFALARQSTFTISSSMDVGMGWHLRKNDIDGEFQPWHNGGTGGYSSCMIIDLHRRTAVVILSNLSGFHPKHADITRLCFKLLDEQD